MKEKIKHIGLLLLKGLLAFLVGVVFCLCMLFITPFSFAYEAVTDNQWPWEFLL